MKTEDVSTPNAGARLQADTLHFVAMPARDFRSAFPRLRSIQRLCGACADHATNAFGFVLAPFRCSVGAMLIHFSIARVEQTMVSKEEFRVQRLLHHTPDGKRNLGIVLRLGIALSQEENIARDLYGTYGAGALGQARTCASLARVMADRSSTGIWNKVIAILTERAAQPFAEQH